MENNAKGPFYGKGGEILGAEEVSQMYMNSSSTVLYDISKTTDQRSDTSPAVEQINLQSKHFSAKHIVKSIAHRTLQAYKPEDFGVDPEDRPAVQKLERALNLSRMTDLTGTCVFYPTPNGKMLPLPILVGGKSSLMLHMAVSNPQVLAVYKDAVSIAYDAEAQNDENVKLWLDRLIQSHGGSKEKIEQSFQRTNNFLGRVKELPTYPKHLIIDSINDAKEVVRYATKTKAPGKHGQKKKVHRVQVHASGLLKGMMKKVNPT